MEPQEEAAEKESVELTVDFSKQTLKRIERADDKQQLAETLILDHNEIQKLDNLETYLNLKKLSLANNQLIRMYGVSILFNLTTLDISNNSLVIIEGLKNLTELTDLNLSRNRIKSIEHLKYNVKLEKIDLSGNNIMCFSDMSFLENLKVLKLHYNRISHMTLCEKYLPRKLEVLTVNNNLIADLNEVSYLAHLKTLREFCILDNPCLDFSDDQKFNYRPFVKNWITSLIVLDNSPLDDIECLKAEWLYSQGRGRSFRPGEHAALIEYLNSVCPREGKENAENEDVKKLKLILSKAQLHQQQLREQLTTGEFFRSNLVKKKSSFTSDRMVSSFQDSPRDFKSTPEIMTRSLDSGTLKKSAKFSKQELSQTPLQTSTTFIPIPDTLISPDVGQPLPTSCTGPSSFSSRTSRSSSRNSPRSTPESKRKTSISMVQRRCENSPMGMKKASKLLNSRSSTPFDTGGSSGKNTPPRNTTSPGKKGNISRDSDRNCRETSEEEDSEVSAMKIKAVQQRAIQKKQNKLHLADKTLPERKEFLDYSVDTKEWRAAVCIQKRWRGYRARNLNGEVLMGCKNIQISRMQDYITKVVRDMEATRNALEGNRKLVALQMQAINSLWKKITSMQPCVVSGSENQICLQNLVQTCATLTKQVEGLQAMMRTMQASSNANSNSYSLIPIGTQTEIVAVHTPQENEKGLFIYSQKSGDNTPSTFSVESDGRYFGESMIDSNNMSTSCTIKTVTELHHNFNADDISNDELISSSRSEGGDLNIFNETLTKPTITLSETNNEVPKLNESESKEKEAESQDSCCS